MKKYGNYLIAISLVFSAAVFGASLITKASYERDIEDSSTIKVDVMGNITGD